MSRDRLERTSENEPKGPCELTGSKMEPTPNQCKKTDLNKINELANILSLITLSFLYVYKKKYVHTYALRPACEKRKVRSQFWIEPCLLNALQRSKLENIFKARFQRKK